jgi:hypothetical protein
MLIHTFNLSSVPNTSIGDLVVENFNKIKKIGASKMKKRIFHSRDTLVTSSQMFLSEFTATLSLQQQITLSLILTDFVRAQDDPHTQAYILDAISAIVKSWTKKEDSVDFSKLIEETCQKILEQLLDSIEKKVFKKSYFLHVLFLGHRNPCRKENSRLTI